MKLSNMIANRYNGIIQPKMLDLVDMFIIFNRAFGMSYNEYKSLKIPTFIILKNKLENN